MDSKTHKYVTETAINIIDMDILTDKKEKIIHYSVLPDTDEKEGAYKNHFFNPSTRKNFMNENNSAYTKVLYYYDKTKNCIEKKLDFSENLGRCIHFFVDINTPVHTYNQDIFDATVNLNSHIYFENFCNNIINELKSDTEYSIINKEDNIYNIENLPLYIENPIDEIINKCAIDSSILFFQYNKRKYKKDVYNIAKQAIINSVRNTIILINKLIIWSIENGHIEI